MSSNPHISPGEAKVLFVLLDAAEEVGMLRNSPLEARWHEYKRHSIGIDFEKEGLVLWEMLDELEHAIAFKGSWIEDRWQSIKTQAARAKSLTNHPFLSMSKRLS